MKLGIDDEYINCSELIQEANNLYELASQLPNMNNDYREYLISMNKYINKYENFREKMIKTYIEDLKNINSS